MPPTPKKDDRSHRLGRSRGGLTTKIHAPVDPAGLPIALRLTEGQAHDGRSDEDMLAEIADGQILLADRAHDSDRMRQARRAQRLSQRQAHAEP
jgi:IS5 family transposase